MHSMRQRACDIVATSVSTFLVMALLTAGTTIVRDLLLQPRPVVHGMRVSAMSPLYHVRTATLVSPNIPDAALYYYQKHQPDGTVTVELPANIELVDLEARADDTEEEWKRKQWQRERVPRGYALGVRTTDRIILHLSGLIDFASLWDWNTKAIYISFVARFRSPTTAVNEVVLLDAVMRSVTVPSELQQLVARRRQEREATRAADATAVAGATSDGAASVRALSPETALLTAAERQQLAQFEQTLRNREHDHPSLVLDHIDKQLHLNASFKYFADAFDAASLEGNTVEVVLRYQVMSYSGWAPVREDALGHQVKVQMPASAILWDQQRL